MSDWGKGVTNNTIEWGRGSTNNSIGWGSVYGDSWSGETELEVGFDADAVAYFTAVEDAGGTLTDNVKAEFDSFVVREKDAGRWDKIKRLYPYLGGKINSAIIDAITLNAATNSNFVDADVDATIGLTGDGSTKSIIESGDITNIITDDYNFAIGFFAKDPVGVTSSGVYYTEYYDGSNRIAIRRLFNSIGAYSGAVSTYFYDSTDITAESNWSFIMGQYTSNSRSILFNGTNVKTNTATNSNPATGFIGDPYKYNHYKSTYVGQSNSSFISQGMSETELIAFESSYKTFINNITAYAASQAYFTAVETAGGSFDLTSINPTYTESYVKSVHNDYILSLKTNGVWDKLTEMWLLCGKTFDGITVKLKGSGSITNVNFVTQDWTAAGSPLGLIGDGFTKELNGGLIDANTATNSMMFADITVANIASGREYCAIRSGINPIFQIDNFTGFIGGHMYNLSSRVTGSSVTTGFAIANSTAANGQVLVNDISIGTATAANQVVSGSVTFEGYSFSTSNGRADGRISLMGHGASLSASELTAFNNATSTFKTALQL